MSGEYCRRPRGVWRKTPGAEWSVGSQCAHHGQFRLLPMSIRTDERLVTAAA